MDVRIAFEPNRESHRANRISAKLNIEHALTGCDLAFRSLSTRGRAVVLRPASLHEHLRGIVVVLDSPRGTKEKEREGRNARNSVTSFFRETQLDTGFLSGEESSALVRLATVKANFDAAVAASPYLKLVPALLELLRCA